AGRGVGPPGRQPGPPQPGVHPPTLAADPSAAADGGGPGVAGQGGPGVAVLGRPADDADVLADLGAERAYWRGEVLRLQRPAAGIAAAAVAGGLHALERRACHPAVQERDRVSPFRGASL